MGLDLFCTLGLHVLVKAEEKGKKTYKSFCIICMQIDSTGWKKLFSFSPKHIIENQVVLQSWIYILEFLKK